MAEAAVSSIVTKLGELLIEEKKFLYGVSSQIEQVRLQLDEMKRFWGDSATIEDSNFKDWVRNVRKVANETENAVDTYLTVMAEGRSKCLLVGKFSRLRARHKLGYKMSKIQSNIRLLDKTRITFGFEKLRKDEEEVILPSRRAVIVDDDDYEIVGFQDVKIKLIEDLVGHRANTRRRVVSVVGQGGRGKTTIALKVYRSSKVKECFDVAIWLTISRGFKLVDILRRGLEMLGREMQDGNEEYLAYELRRALGNRKYLVVLDDVWTDDLFIELKEMLPDANNCSRVLMTSRSIDVARSADPASTPHELRLLTDDEGIELLRIIAFRGANSCSWDDLINVAKQLVKKCGNLPLAIKIVGGLLSQKNPTIHDWDCVLQTFDWQHDDTHGMKIQAMSYEDLPLALRPCFLYLACFPEDHEIDARPLLWMWIAEGFIPSSSPSRMLEDEAERYLEELAGR